MGGSNDYDRAINYFSALHHSHQFDGYSFEELIDRLKQLGYKFGDNHYKEYQYIIEKLFKEKNINFNICYICKYS